MLAHVLTGQYTKKLRGKQIFIVPLVAAFIMVMWDLSVDPISSTLQGLWVWTYPGAYFGVPIINFFGWFLLVYLFFQIFALYLSKYDSIKLEKSNKLKQTLLGRNSNCVWHHWPGYYTVYFLPVKRYSVSMALITVFTMLFVTLLALINMGNNEHLS